MKPKRLYLTSVKNIPIGQFVKSDGITTALNGEAVGHHGRNGGDSRTSSTNKNREKVTSSQVKNRRGTDLIGDPAVAGGENSNSMTLFPEINPGVVADNHHRNINNCALKSGVKQRNTSQ